MSEQTTDHGAAREAMRRTLLDEIEKLHAGPINAFTGPRMALENATLLLCMDRLDDALGQFDLCLQALELTAVRVRAARALAVSFYGPGEATP